jgi:hypothetical protein
MGRRKRGGDVSKGRAREGCKIDVRLLSLSVLPLTLPRGVLETSLRSHMRAAFWKS